MVESATTEPVYVFKEVQSEVKALAQQTVEEVLGEVSYHPSDVHVWTKEITEKAVKRFKQISAGAAGFKYIANCVILQKKNAGFHTNTTCLWDQENDGNVVVRYGNSSMYCILTVYCISLMY